MQQVTSTLIQTVSTSQLKQGNATLNQSLMWNGTAWAPGNPLPTGVNGSILMYDSSVNSWVASTIPLGGSGTQGPQGLRGVPGLPGETGATGPQGPAGRDGVAAAVGLQGPKGDTGQQGLQGIKGDTGPMGPQGLVGLTGPQGLTGASLPGPAGPIGPQGLQGHTGSTGPVGPQGPQGLKGDTGPQGLTGAQGPQGLGGTGPQGLKGDIGHVGPTGLTGPVGPEGPVGPRGLQGYSGLQGPQGLQGLTGPKGDTGNTGPQGATGVQGPTGLTGSTGPAGPQGLKGDAGTPGAPGVKGDAGDSLPIGSIMYFSASTAPVGYLECNGDSISRTTYAALFAVIGTLYGSTDSTHFTLPDLRGEFVRGWDHGKGVDLNRTFGSWQKGTLVAGYDDNNNGQDVSYLKSKQQQGGTTDYGTDNIDVNTIGATYGITNVYWVANYSSTVTYPLTYASSWFSITRPRNVALLPCIKYSVTTPLAPVAFDSFIPKPTPTPNNGDTLTYSSSQGKWIASAASSASSNPFSAKAWVNFDSTRNSAGGTDSLNTNRFIVSSHNISRVTKTGTGDYNVYFITPMVDKNYCILSSAGNGDGTRATSMPSYYSSPTTTSMQITVVGQDWNGKDLKHVHVFVFEM